MNDYEEFRARLRRDLNCLSDKDRNTRRTGLQRVDKAIRYDVMSQAIRYELMRVREYGAN